MSKTIWQWLAVTCYFTGLVTLLWAWVTMDDTKVWAMFISTTWLLWLIAILCVMFKPVGGKS